MPTHDAPSHRSTRRATALLGALCALGVSVAASAHQRLRFITYDAPGAGTVYMQGTAFVPGTGCFVYSDCARILNNWGAVTGDYLDANNVYRGFVRSPDGKITEFDAPGADLTRNNLNGTFPNSINDAGVITGFYLDVNGVSHGFLRSPEGAFTTFDVTFNGVPGSSTTPISLNLEGAVVGYASDQNGLFHGFLRRPNGRFVTWIGPGGCTASNAAGCYGTGAFGINFFGTISGAYEDNSGNFVDHGLIRSPQGKFTVYNAPGAGTGPYQGTGCPGCSVPVNQFGATAGYVIDAQNVVHGYLRHPWGEITTFDAPAGAGSAGFGCFADCSLGLNDWGAITGSYADASFTSHGFLRSRDGHITTFDAPGADTTAGDFNGTFPISINDWGAVAGFYIDKNNVMHGFLLLPSEDEGERGD